MFYYLIITLIIFRSPLRFEMVMAATTPVAAAPATATAEGTARGRRGSRMGEGRKRAQTTGPGILTVYFDCLVHLYTHTYSL